MEIIMVIPIIDSTIQPTTGEHRWGPARELKSIQIPIAEDNPQVTQYLLAITLIMRLL